MTKPDTPPPSETRAWISYLARAALTTLLFAVAFCVVQRLTFALRLPSSQRTTIWTPGALTFTALLLTPLRGWWVYYTGLCLGAITAFYGDTSITAPTALLAAQFHFGAVALGTWGIRRFGANPPFGSLFSLVVFIVIAVVLVPVMTTGPIDLVRIVSGADDVWPVALRAFLSIALGMLIATPALTLTVTHGLTWIRAASRRDYLEVVALAVGLGVAGYFCFAEPTGATASPALLYAPLPLLLWAAARFELAGVCWALLALAFQSTWAAVEGHGPFTNQAPADNVLQLQLFLLAISLPLMFLAIVIQERRRTYSALSESVSTVVREITERKQTEERFRLVVESAPNAIVMVNVQGNIVLVNSQCERCFGYLREELVGQPVEVLVPERYRARHPGYRVSFFASPSVRPMGVGRELYGRRKDGSEFPVEIGLTPIQTGAGFVVLSAIVDISERKRSEEVRQELAHASRLAMVGELTASIAHEINQPLGAILSNADASEMLLESGSASLKEVRQILDDIRNDALRASEVIRRLRALLRKHELEMQSLDLNEVTSEVLTLVRAETLRRGVVVETDLAVNLPAVRGDKVHFQQVLLNLVLNGMEAMADIPETKRLAVRTALNKKGCVEIAVTDAGPGIPLDRLSQLFDAFFTTKKEGMGLGLSIARSLVEAHGGRIWAENSPAGGATFRFTLPTGAHQPIAKPTDNPSAPMEFTA